METGTLDNMTRDLVMEKDLLCTRTVLLIRVLGTVEFVMELEKKPIVFPNLKASRELKCNQIYNK